LNFTTALQQALLFEEFSKFEPNLAMANNVDPGRATLILVLGILSLVVCQPIGPFAWVMGSNDLKKIEAGEISKEAKPLTQAGMICGIIGTVLLILGIIGALIAISIAVLGALVQAA
jgi:hypothetical protein